MIKELSLAKKKDLSKEELELHVKAFYNHIKTNEEGMITRESFYNYYKKQWLFRANTIQGFCLWKTIINMDKSYLE